MPPIEPVAQLDPFAARLHWSHSITFERDFLSEWRAIELASEVATDLGSSADLRTDVFALPLRKKAVPHQVSFDSMVQVFLGMDNDFEFHAVRVHHDTLAAWPEKPWNLRASCEADDLTSFMARRPGPFRRSAAASTTPSSMTSSSSLSLPSSSSRVVWQRTVLILLDGRMFPARLSNDAEDTIEHQIAQAIGILPDEVLASHNVLARPEDLVSQNLHCSLPQLHDERRPSPFLRLVLVDMEIYEPNEILPGAFRRFSKWLPRTINRRSVFRMLDLESLLDIHGERCRLWFNNNLIADDFIEPLHLEDGDYIRILIGDHDSDFQCDDSSAESTDFMAGLQLPLEVLPRSFELAMPVDMDPLLNVQVCSTSTFEKRILPFSMSVDEDAEPPPGNAQGIPDPLQAAFDRPPGIDRPEWIHETWDLLIAYGAVEFAEEGPIMYFRSHYISHRHHRTNRASRPLRFDTDFETWEADIRFMWEDFMDDSAFDLFFVAPEPISRPTSGTVATVLVVQHPQPGRVACLVSHPRLEAHSSQNEIALSLATPCTSAVFLHCSGLTTLCTQQRNRQTMRCEILVGSIIQEHDQPLRLHNGLGLRVQLRTRTEAELTSFVTQLRAEDDVDDIQLWTNHWHIQTPDSKQTSLHSQAQVLERCLATSMRLLEEDETGPSLTPLAIPEDHPEEAPVTDRFPDHQGDILDSWRAASTSTFATDTIDGEIHVKFVTWFLNGDLWPRCDAFRTVALPADPERWDAIFRQTWRDRADPATQFQTALVYPPVTPDQHGGHLIIHQNLGPSVRGTLLSVFWHGQESELGSRFAQVVPHWLSFQRFLHFADLLDACRRRILLCVGFSGSHPIDDDRPLFPRHGTHVEIHAAEWQIVDENSLMQQPGAPQLAPAGTHAAPPQVADCDASQLNADAPIFVPGVPWEIGSMSEFTQDLHAIWQDAAFSWEDESPSCPILVWFVDHQWHAPHGRTARIVHLYDDFHTWEDRIRRTWADHIVEGAVIELHLVDPKPPTVQQEVATHVVLVQRPNAVWVTSVVTLIESRGRGRRPAMRQLAITTHEHILINNLMRVYGLHDHCLGPRAQLQCEGWYGTVPLHSGRPIPGRSGYGIILRTQPIPQPRPTATTVNHTMRSPILLQLASLLQRDDHSSDEGFAPLHEEASSPSVAPVTVALRLRSGCDQLIVPEYIECSAPGAPADIEAELTHWGIDCKALRFGHRHEALCFPAQWTAQVNQFHYMFCHEDVKDNEGIFLHTSNMPLDELGLMQLLYQLGYCRAAILDKEELLPQVFRVLFLDVVQQPLTEQGRIKKPLPWPALSHHGRHNRPYFDPSRHPDEDKNFLIKLGITMQDIDDFFKSGDDLLCRDPTGLDLPETTKQAMLISDTTDLARFDRLIIYTDGSSIPLHRHRPAAWNEENGNGDTWAYVVLGERSVNQHPAVEVIGWLTHPVRYDPHCPSFLGSTYVGSLGAEREAMTWAALWRLAHNVDTPTLFRTDSWTTAMQAQGHIGTADVDASFTSLRSCFQALEAALPDRLQVEHTPGHCGDPYNDFADWLAREERRRSFYSKRQAISLDLWRPFLPYMWMLFSQTDGLPSWSSQGFHVPPPQLPSPLATPTCEGNELTSDRAAKIDISLASANIGSMYNGEWGHAGKLDYLRTQFKLLCLNFLGLQETRTPELFSRTDKILRFASGALHGQHGIELWVNLEQAYAVNDDGPIFFAPHHFVVVHKDHRSMLIHVVTEWVDFWILVAHAPQSGVALSERQIWWDHLLQITAACPQTARLFALLDANAGPGSADHISVFRTIGGHTSSTPLLRTFLQERNLCLPCTASCHEGTNTTWTTPDGLSEHMIDYIAIPQTCLSECSISRVLDEFDLGNSHHDHSAVALQLHWQELRQSHSAQSSKPRIDFTLVQHEHVEQALGDYVVPAWTENIEDQVSQFNGHLLARLQNLCPHAKHRPKKPCIDEATWNLRTQKLIARRGLRQLARHHRLELLRACFQSWTSRPGYDKARFWHYGRWLQCANVKLLARHYKSAAQLKAKLRARKTAYLKHAFENLPTDAPASSILHELKKVVGSTNLKAIKQQTLPLIKDSTGQPCTSPSHALDTWIHFFQHMEGGRRVDKQEQHQLWVQNL